MIKDVIADAMLQQVLTRPREYDVIATLNLNGDYISDALAAQVGGIGIAPGANINYVSGHAVFEATHGTAPKYAGKDMVNPGSVILSGEMMLRYLGWNEAADLVIRSLAATIAQKTRDLRLRAADGRRHQAVHQRVRAGDGGEHERPGLSLGTGGTRTMLGMEDRERPSCAETLLHLHRYVTAMSGRTRGTAMPRSLNLALREFVNALSKTAMYPARTPLYPRKRRRAGRSPPLTRWSTATR